ncbi:MULTISPECIES: hypothetical protein [unclassified Pannonibacter]|uniref:hypothetical protein n=1 Tax=unclassified Pannonibacter TaxID=2627228 RepID=UPI0016447C76|nr:MULTISPECIES: hypothetical protein [unclassified Pannonibacter]
MTFKVWMVGFFMATMPAIAQEKAPNYASPLADGTTSSQDLSAQAAIYGEAVEDIKYLDCHLRKKQDEMAEMADELRAISKRLSILLWERDNLTAKALEALEVKFSSDQLRDGLPISLTLNEVPRILSKRVLEIVDAADSALRLTHAAFTLVKLQQLKPEIALESAAFQKIRDELSYWNTLQSIEWEKRNAKYEEWEARGVVFQRPFYGLPEFCDQKGNTFDGTWALSWGNQPAYAINGAAFRFLSPREYRYTDFCTPHYSDLIYASDNEATVRFHHVCPDGSQGQRGFVTLVRTDGVIGAFECVEKDGHEPAANCMAAQQYSIPLIRIPN